MSQASYQVNDGFQPSESSINFGGFPNNPTKEPKEPTEKELEAMKKGDPWALPELEDKGVPWSELDNVGRFKRVALVIVKVTLLLGFLYIFICSLSFLSSAFRLLGGKAAGRAFAENEILSNPVAGLVIGVLVTVLVQSSSTSTSIVVAMVASDVLKVKNAIPIVMGANIGTTVTNTIVSLGQSVDRAQFRRAFAAATVHDMFNLLSVLVFLPIEAATGYLFYVSDALVGAFHLKENKALKQDYLKKITKPFEDKIVQIDKKVIEEIAKASTEAERKAIEAKSLIKFYCAKSKHNVSRLLNVTDPTTNKTTLVTQYAVVEKADIPCEFLFHDSGLTDAQVGGILFVISLVLLCACLIFIVKILHSMFKGRMAAVTHKVVNTDFPSPFGFLTGYLAILVGAVLTFFVQSSSIFTSTLTPLVGVGVISVERMYPLTLGSNIGTTTTAILASFAASSDKIRYTLQIALCHLLFNISGIILWYPVPHLRKLPIKMSKCLGNTTAEYRWFAVAYVFTVFLIIPGIIFGVSLAGWKVLVGVGVPILLLIIVIVVVNILQSKLPERLPEGLRSWEWAPLCLRSLEPYDRGFRKVKEVTVNSFSRKKESRSSSTVGQPNPTFSKEMDEVVISK